MNEYRIPDQNIQNGVLKALSFMFEYIGEMAKGYIYSVTGLLEDACMDRDMIHRQTAATTIKHLALGVVGLGSFFTTYIALFSLSFFIYSLFSFPTLRCYSFLLHFVFLSSLSILKHSLLL